MKGAAVQALKWENLLFIMHLWSQVKTKAYTRSGSAFASASKAIKLFTNAAI